jgi:hypothetical protein
MTRKIKTPFSTRWTGFFDATHYFYIRKRHVMNLKHGHNANVTLLVLTTDLMKAYSCGRSRFHKINNSHNENTPTFRPSGFSQFTYVDTRLLSLRN